MKNKKSNSIAGVGQALEKLQTAFTKEYSQEECHFDVSVNPYNGKYFVLVSLKNQKLNSIFPPTVDGYMIAIKETMSDPFWMFLQSQKNKNFD
jgi:hypothetical protein